MVNFPVPSDVPVAATALTARAPQSSRHLLTRDERKERYMAKTRFEAAYLFKYLILTQIVVYLEAGAIPCLLDQLSVSLSMTAAQQGALGGVVYLALSAASPLCAFCLYRFNPKHVLGLSLILNNMAVLLLAFTPTGYTWSADLMIAARALIGFTQAFPCVYTPLWVDEYAPREKVAGWMSYLQGSVPMGVMLGYFIGTVSNWLVPESFQVVETWRWPFVVQFVCMCPIMIAVLFVPKRHVVIRSESGSSKSPRSDSIAASDASLSGHSDDVCVSTSDVSDENQSIEAAEALLRGEIETIDAVEERLPSLKATAKGGRPPKSVGYNSSNSDAHNASLRHTIAGGEAIANNNPQDDDDIVHMLQRNAPTSTSSRSSYVHKDEEDALLASASMYGGSSQRGLRQLVQNHQYHSYSLSETDNATSNSVGSSSFRRALLSTPLSNNNNSNARHNTAPPTSSQVDLERGHEPLPTDAQSTTLTRLPASPIRASTYGAFDQTTASLPPGTNTRSLLDQSILEEEFCEVYEQGSFTDGLVELAHIPIFSLIVAGLTAVYFVVTGVQYWSTIFMIKSLHASKYLVNALFVVVAGTGPIFGVFYGGWLIDRYGGYIGVEQRAKSLGICMLLGITAFVIAAVTTFFDDIYVTAAFLWLLLFFGGSILPACTGIFISVVPAEHRALASSLSVMVFNLFGYSLSPYLTGLMMEYVLSHQTQTPLDPLASSNIAKSYLQSCDEACAYRLGFRFCLLWSIGSVICIGSAYKLAKRDAENARHVLEFYAPTTTTTGMQRSVSSDEV